MDSKSKHCSEDFNKICRICTRPGDLEPLENFDIDDIKNLIPSSSTEGNKLSKYICKNCLSVLSFISKNKNASLLKSINCDHDYQSSSSEINKPCNIDKLLNVENSCIETDYNFINKNDIKQEIKAEVETEQSLERNTKSTELDSEYKLEKPLNKNFIKKTKTKLDKNMTVKENKPRKRKHKYESIKILIEDSFQCSFCDESFVDNEQLDDHFLTKHITGENFEEGIIIKNEELYDDKNIFEVTLDMVTKADHFQCEICNNKFTRKSSLKDHIKIHTGEKKFECPFPGCDYRFISKGPLNRHLTVHSEEKQFMCYYCGKHLTQKAYLAKHIQKMHSANGRIDIKTEKPRYKCLVCGRGFYYEKTLELHKIIHKNIDRKKLDRGVPKLFLCPQCGMRFSFKCNLDRHSLSHTGIKPFQCNICGDKFTTKNSLQCHINIHTDLRPYNCERCPKKFRHPSSLRKHMLVHTGERHFKCELCSATFKRSNHLNVHFKRHLR